MQPDLIWIPANSANFMYGRQGRGVSNITYHHVVGSAQSAVNKFLQPVQVSAHFVVASDRIYCMVDTDNTAYTNSNWISNLESVTIEHEGTWLNGFRDEGVIANSARLTAWLRTIYPGIGYNRHRDVSQVPTACCGDLPVEEIWQRASDILNPPQPPAPTPAPPVDDRPEWLKNRSDLVATKYANKGNVQLWNLNDPSQPADSRLFAVNTKFDIGSTTTVGGQQYFITVYSTSKNIGAGYKATDLDDKEYTEPVQPPAVIPAPVPDPIVETPPVPTPPPTEEPGTIVTPAPQEPPAKPVKKPSLLIQLLIWVLNLLPKRKK